MIRDADYWRAWERGWIASQPADFEQNLRIVEALAEEAKALGRWPAAGEADWEGLESRLRLARALHVSSTSRPPGG